INEPEAIVVRSDGFLLLVWQVPYRKPTHVDAMDTDLEAVISVTVVRRCKVHSDIRRMRPVQQGRWNVVVLGDGHLLHQRIGIVIRARELGRAPNEAHEHPPEAL